MLTIIYLISQLVVRPTSTPMFLVWVLMAIDLALVTWLTYHSEKESKHHSEHHHGE